MGDRDALESILAALHEAMLDDSRWPDVSALMDDACGITGNDFWSGKARPTTSGLSSSEHAGGGSAAKSWSATTSRTTTPPMSAYRASDNWRTVGSRTPPTCIRPRS